MTPEAIQTFSTFGVGVLCAVLGIVTLTVFFTALSRLGSAKPETITVRGILKKDTWATVHMTGAETFERVRFVGFTSTESLKTHLPYDLNAWSSWRTRRGRGTSSGRRRSA